MSQNFIKIFDDTVLKQSINQGTEEQRTAANLGRFTMGELAFTRDTGRLFIGNHSSKSSSELELPQIQGGIIAGNKYLGFIDSKPLSWWTRGDGSSLPLNFEVDTTYDGKDNSASTEDDYLREKGLLTPQSKYRNKKGDDGKNYNGKWDKKAHYNETLDAYDGDYMYDIYQNAFILFDKNISESLNPNKSTKSIKVKDTQNPSVTNTVLHEIYVDDNGEELPIKDQLRRTEIKNLSQDFCKDYPVYGDGYVIFRNIEPDGKTIRFKPKSFSTDGTPHYYEDNNTKYDFQSHNIIEVISVPGSAMTEGHSDNFIIKNGKVELNDKVITNVNSIKNDSNSITLPSVLKLFAADKTSTAISLDFSEANDRTFKTIGDNNYILALTEESENNYSVSVAKSKNSNFYIRLGEGLKNKGRGGDKLIELLAGDTASSSNTPLLTIESDSSYLSSGYYSDPFYINDVTLKDNFYAGNLTLEKGGVVSVIDKYDDKYESATSTQRERFESSGNVATNLFKKPIPIIWNLSSSYTLANVNARFLFNTKPYLFCMKKEVHVNSAGATNTQHENGVIVLGNNSIASKSVESDYYIIPHYNVSSNVTGLSKAKKSFRDYTNLFTTSHLLSINGILDKDIGYSTSDSYKEYVLFEDDGNFNENFFNKFANYLNGPSDKDPDRVFGKISSLTSEQHNAIFNKNFDLLKPIIDFDVDFSSETDDDSNSQEDLNLSTAILNIRINTNRRDINLRCKNKFVKTVKLTGINGNTEKTILNSTIIRNGCNKCEEIYNTSGANAYQVYYDETNGLVFKKNTNSSFTVSLYANSDLLLNANNLIAKLIFEFKDESFDTSSSDKTIDTESIKLIDDIHYNKSITLIQSSITIEKNNKTKTIPVYSVSNSNIDLEEDNSILGSVILSNSNNSYTALTPESFLEKIGKNKITDTYITINLDDVCNNTALKNYNFISFVMVNESDEERKDDGSDSTYYPTRATNVITYQPVNSYCASNGLHEPKNYKNVSVYPPNGGTVSAKNLIESIPSSSDLYGVIPYHASSIILEVRYKTSNNKPLSIFTAADFDSMRAGGASNTTIQIYNDTISSPYSVTNTDTYEIAPPTSFGTDAFSPNINEKQLLYTKTSTIETITVPLYPSDYDYGKTFNLRVAGINNNGGGELLLIRAIGYNA